jgi:hypothetical protein
VCTLSSLWSVHAINTCDCPTHLFLFSPHSTTAIIMSNSVTLTTISIPVSFGGGSSSQDQREIPESCASLTIAGEEYKIQPETDDKPITLKWFDDSVEVTCDGMSCAFGSDAVATVNCPSQITGRPTKSQVIKHKYNSAKVSWVNDLKMVKVLDQKVEYFRHLGVILWSTK